MSPGGGEIAVSVIQRRSKERKASGRPEVTRREVRKRSKKRRHVNKCAASSSEKIVISEEGAGRKEGEEEGRRNDGKTFEPFCGRKRSWNQRGEGKLQKGDRRGKDLAEKPELKKKHRRKKTPRPPEELLERKKRALLQEPMLLPRGDAFGKGIRGMKEASFTFKRGHITEWIRESFERKGFRGEIFEVKQKGVCTPQTGLCLKTPSPGIGKKKKEKLSFHGKGRSDAF